MSFTGVFHIIVRISAHTVILRREAGGTEKRFFAALRMTSAELRMTSGALRMTGGVLGMTTHCHPEARSAEGSFTNMNIRRDYK